MPCISFFLSISGMARIFAAKEHFAEHSIPSPEVGMRYLNTTMAHHTTTALQLVSRIDSFHTVKELPIQNVAPSVRRGRQSGGHSRSGLSNTTSHWRRLHQLPWRWQRLVRCLAWPKVFPDNQGRDSQGTCVWSRIGQMARRSTPERSTRV